MFCSSRTPPPHPRALPAEVSAGGSTKSCSEQLDQVYRLKPEVHRWELLPGTFRVRFELMSGVELAPPARWPPVRVDCSARCAAGCSAYRDAWLALK